MKSYPLPEADTSTLTLDGLCDWIGLDLDLAGLSMNDATDYYLPLEVVWVASAAITMYGIYQQVCGLPRI